MDHSRNCIFAQYNNLMTHFLSFHMWAPQVCVQEFRMHCMRHPCSPPLQFWLHSSPPHFRLHVWALHCCTQWLPAWHRISHWLCTPRCMFAHLNQNLMNNFSLRYIHECGTFDCRYDRCILFGIFALHFCKTRTFVTLGYDALSSCTEINTIFRALCTYQWPWPMQKSNLISSVLFFFYICKVEGEPSS